MTARGSAPRMGTLINSDVHVSLNSCFLYPSSSHPPLPLCFCHTPDAAACTLSALVSERSPEQLGITLDTGVVVSRSVGFHGLFPGSL